MTNCNTSPKYHIQDLYSRQNKITWPNLPITSVVDRGLNPAFKHACDKIHNKTEKRKADNSKLKVNKHIFACRFLS